MPHRMAVAVIAASDRPLTHVDSEAVVLPARDILRSAILVPAAKRKRTEVNLDANARPTAAPNKSVRPRDGSCNHKANATIAANCMQAVGMSEYAIPANASTVGTVVNSATAVNPARAPNSRHAPANTSAAQRIKNGRTPIRARDRFRR